MSDEKSVECNCEKCLQSIEKGADLLSLGQYDIICQSCFDEYSTCSGYRCTEVGTSFAEASNGELYCESCAEDLHTCYGCEELIDSNQQSLYHYEYDSYCSRCADSSTAYECSCGDTVSIAIAVGYEDEDFVINETCEECHERDGRIEHIDSSVETSIDKSILDKAYIKRDYRAEEKLTAAQLNDYESFSQFFNEFYGYDNDSYKSQKLIIRKGAFGYERWGWFETSIEIESEVNERIFKMLDYLITDNGPNTKRQHRKLGRYQPFSYAFAELCEFYIQSSVLDEDNIKLWRGDNRYIKRRYPTLELNEFMELQKRKLKGGAEWDDLIVHNVVWLNYYVDYLDRAKLRQCIKARKMPDGKCLVKTVNKLLAQHSKSYQQFRDAYNINEEKARIDMTSHPLAPTDLDKYNSSYMYDTAWDISGTPEKVWKLYCTNSISVSIPARIGFDAKAHEKVIAFNDSIGACQGESYKDTLGFNHIAMSSNPHLYLLFFDPEDESSIIGRSVIRLLWKRDESAQNGYGEPLKKTLYLAPSRLYQKGYTHAKNQFYAGMYKALDKWKDTIAKSLGADEVKLIAYHKSRHDSYTIKDYIDMAKDTSISRKLTELDLNTGSRKLGKFVTDWCYPIWLEIPSNEDGNGAFWGYYPDEYQSYESAYVDSSVYSQYATRETYNGQYSYIEVKNE